MSKKTAFITGASRGIGAACAIELARKGFDVAITARTLKDGEQHEHGIFTSEKMALRGSLDSVAADIRELGQEAYVFRGDILEPETIEDAFDKAVSAMGRVDVVINNAMFEGPASMSRVVDIVPSDLLQVYQGNVVTPMQLIQRALPSMVERNSGTIVNLISGTAFSDPEQPSDKGGWGFGYGSSKGALMRLAGVLRAEYQDTALRFFNIEPGFVLNEVMKASGIDKDLIAMYGEDFGGVSADDVARVIVWLCVSQDTEAYEKDYVFAPDLLAKVSS